MNNTWALPPLSESYQKYHGWKRPITDKRVLLEDLPVIFNSTTSTDLGSLPSQINGIRGQGSRGS